MADATLSPSAAGAGSAAGVGNGTTVMRAPRVDVTHNFAESAPARPSASWAGARPV